MSRESITVELQVRGITTTTLIYSQQFVSVYKGFYQSFDAAIKVITLTHNFSQEAFSKEITAMLRFDHPNILKLYNFQQVEKPGAERYHVIVTEWCAKDLGKDIEQRKTNKYPFSEDEIISVAKKVVGALSYMQKAGVAHRDVKPANVFVTREKEFKLGDFGSVSFVPSQMDSMTLTGTPLYLSPALRAAFAHSSSNGVRHNVFKSDVYSLGLSLLHMALLDFSVSYSDLRTSREAKAAIVASINYSKHIKDLLGWMLQEDEVLRCDFIELEAYFNGGEDRSRSEGQTGASTRPSDVYRPGQSSASPSLHHGSLVSSGKVTCLYCQNLIAWSPSTPLSILTLYCRPYEHVFCSPTCYSRFADSHKPKADMVCPSCKEPISPDVYAGYLPDVADTDTEDANPRSEPQASYHPSPACVPIYVNPKPIPPTFSVQNRSMSRWADPNPPPYKPSPVISMKHQDDTVNNRMQAYQKDTKVQNIINVEKAHNSSNCCQLL